MSGVPGGWRRLLAEIGPTLVRRFRGGAGDVLPPPPWWYWRHVVKLDPDRPVVPTALAQLYASGTDAVVVGGTQGITAAKVLSLLERLRQAPCPVALEVSDPSAAVPAVAAYFVPLVLNAGETRWIAGSQAGVLADLLPRYGHLIPWERMWPAAYLVQNPDSAVGRRTGAGVASRSEATGFGALAGRLWRLPLMYVEYSGCYGDPELVRAVRRAAGSGCRVWYGGGIESPDQARAMAAAAHTVVVGNLAHHHPERIAATVRAVRAVRPPG